MVVHNPVAGSIAVGDILVEDSLAVGRNPAGDNLVEGIPVVGHTPAEDNLDTLHLAAGNPAAARNLVADNFVAAADSSFGFVRTAAALLPVVRNTCKTALRPATAGNNSYST